MIDREAAIGALEQVTSVPLAAPISRDGRYRLRGDAVVLRIEHEDGVYVASDDFSTVYGSGADAQAAVADYVDELYAYIAKLERREAILARGLRDELAVLRRYVEPVS